ncbi:MAG TPA: HAD-IIIC family phosphatase [Polyangiaceae bacterium]|nr:HAD-IIIC family phosphatase [Polyangiaceae bacterium]
MSLKLNEALKLAQASSPGAAQRRAFLACGFEPLHLPVFLRAHHELRFPAQGLEVSTGVYGDLPGNLERARQSPASTCFVLIEWHDLDPRLGVRSTGPWSRLRQAEIAREVAQRLERLRQGLERLSGQMQVVLAPPSIEFGLSADTTGWQASSFELELQLLLSQFLASVAGDARRKVLHAARLAARSPAASRADARMELLAGFPYSLEHASQVAEALVWLAYPDPPKKGLITDLDETLWAGIVGELGADGVKWSLGDKAQLHGLYQSVLRQLHEAGVLLGVASKNDPEVVAAALARSDLHLDRDVFFPVAASWGPKSDAVSAILRAWNIAADAVVVVDDSRMELEEIRRQHPGITCLEFRPRDVSATLELLGQLRDVFGKPSVNEEDRLRSASIRGLAQFEEQKQASDLGSFLAGLAGEVSVQSAKQGADGRVLELINKTNQFNLNGGRVEAGAWQRFLARDDSFVLGVSYGDRFGPLGTIGVVAGTRANGLLHVEHWVLSCRAFSRRIEDHMLQVLFEGQEQVSLAFRRTERNQPFREFLARLGLAEQQGGGELARALVLGREQLARVSADLPHRVLKRSDGVSDG